MPRGMGDGGLWNDGDLYGVFFTHNIWAVYGDKCSLEAAEILGKTEDIPELEEDLRDRARRSAYSPRSRRDHEPSRRIPPCRARKRTTAGFPA